jgi:CDP-paratose 2-epimerase
MFFGEQGSTARVGDALKERWPEFRLHGFDIRDQVRMNDFFWAQRPDAVVHTAGQPSHDWAASNPMLDFDVNAVGTLVLLEAARQHAPEAPFVFLSTNKVYGDGPNELRLVERETRWDFADDIGIDETFPIDRTMHSIFGASKLAADIMVQEYGQLFNMRTCCLRCGCLTGAGHAAVEQHGFLSYLTKCAVQRRPYTVYGFEGKQVRDNLHADDVASFVECFITEPAEGGIYNLGGGRENSVSILEAIAMLEDMLGHHVPWTYEKVERKGDHVVYYSDLTLSRAAYAWSVTRDVPSILEELVADWGARCLR